MKNENPRAIIVKDIRSSFIHFPHVKRILAALDRMYEYQCGNEEAEHIVLLGESGVGKSTLLEKYSRMHPAVVHEEFTEVPVLYVALGQSPTPRSMAGTSLKVLGDPRWYVGKEVELTDRLVFLIKQCRVRLVIVDEANHLVDRGGEKTLHNSADWLKRLVEATRVSFVLAGIPRTRRLLETNDQLRDRFREVIEIDRFSVANRSTEHEFRSVLKVFKGYLRDLPTIDISGAAIARLFAFATDGRLRDIQRLLVRAVELAYERPSPGLTDAILAESFRRVIYPGSPDKRNPFHNAFNETPLVKAHEPFEPVRR
ncbi:MULTISPECIES: TniB family NTP-binding protein [Paraburkholderia]|uniref:TniB family NTP-binding protein n=1 Tax=Paraburkholderia TaxID=1822464 RepID=UPI00225248A0|nr:MULTISPECIES: TniB family NTP-binding protein [Paraburkholderia]MCX4164585.1 TniB family NTP-binding protein [Paraburkholderia megapolitana]MDN7160078.1 TniB family NTP-binding protein [Paraburkholderia sp. CHISQ3]MDQ6497125.1 TniB family NTP-binding protein [Paraburkholderia megapolitana]